MLFSIARRCLLALTPCLGVLSNGDWNIIEDPGPGTPGGIYAGSVTNIKWISSPAPYDGPFSIFFLQYLNNGTEEFAPYPQCNFTVMSKSCLSS
jgi:hypothetical protein